MLSVNQTGLLHFQIIICIKDIRDCKYLHMVQVRI